MAIDLSSKTALVTGASRGIGEATARKLVEYGANVVLAARSLEDTRRIAGKIGDQAIAVSCDVCRYEDVADAVGIAKERFGGLDILVNNAGTIEPIARLEASSPEHWGQAVDINLKGVYHGLRAAYPAMSSGGGVVINLSSGAATGALEGWSHYCATKAGVLSLTRCAHKEWSGASASSGCPPVPSPPTCRSPSRVRASTRSASSTGRRISPPTGSARRSPGSPPTLDGPTTAPIFP